MGIFSNWMMASDIDGTLIGDDCILHDADIKAVSEFIKDGGTFVLATGRSADSARRFYDQLGLTAPIICNNGTLVLDFKEETPLYTNALEDAVSDLVQYVLDGFPEAGVEIYGPKDIYFLRHNRMVKEHIEREDLIVLDSTLASAPKPWCKILFAIDPPLMERFRRFIEDSPFRDRYLFTQSAPFFYEASKIGASKGEAVAYLTEALGFSNERLITIGDNENDAKMLSLTPFSFAVGNAAPYAKNAAAYETTAWGSTGGAVAEAIARIKEHIQKEGM